MKNQVMKPADNIIMAVPKELFEEAGIPTDGGFELYCGDGEIIITEQIADNDDCDENCENCPCYDECEAECERQEEIHDFILSLNPEEIEIVKLQLALKQIVK